MPRQMNALSEFDVMSHKCRNHFDSTAYMNVHAVVNSLKKFIGLS